MITTIILAAFIGIAGISAISLVRDMVSVRRQERLRQRAWTGTAMTEGLCRRCLLPLAKATNRLADPTRTVRTTLDFSSQS